MATKQGSDDIDPVRRLQALIQDIRIAMLVTHVGESGLHGRPMETQATPFDGRLWFFTSASSPKTLEVEEDSEVALIYSDAQTQRYVFVTGRARISDDRAMKDRLWQPQHAAWFAGGKDDPDLRLLEVRVTRALYWLRGDPMKAHAEISEAARGEHRPQFGEGGTIEFEEQGVPGAEGAAAEHTRPVVTGSDRSPHNTGRAGGTGNTRH